METVRDSNREGAVAWYGIRTVMSRTGRTDRNPEEDCDAMMARYDKGQVQEREDDEMRSEGFILLNLNAHDRTSLRPNETRTTM